MSRRVLSILLLTVGLAACSGTDVTDAVTGAPGLSVADAALRGGSPQVALQVTSGILSRDPDNARALTVRGDALTSLGQYADAAASYTRALQRDPLLLRAKIGLGRLRLGTDPAEAETLFLEVLQADPRDTIALNNLGIARDLQGRHQDAQRAYRQALGINPDMAAPQVNLALSLAMSGQGENAIRLIQPLAASPGASRKLRHDYAAVLAMSGKRAEAERILSEDLPPAEVRQALSELDRGVRPGPTPLSPTPGSVPTQVAAEASGDVQVQIAALPTEDAAWAEWQRLQEKQPAALAGRRPVIAAVNGDQGRYWRLRIGGLPTTAEARALCETIRAGGTGCSIVAR
ncbi:MAG: tetratricopeptide repeat protein [Acetobacteraceae bacterium]